MAVTEETAQRAAFTGVAVHTGLGAGLLVALIVLAPAVQSLAFDAGVPLGITDARLLAYAYPALVAALALVGAFATGLIWGRDHPVEPVDAIVHVLVAGIVGLIILLFLGHVGLLIGIALVAAPAEATTVSAATLGFFFLLLVPYLVTGTVTALLVSHLADEADVGAGAGAGAPAGRTAATGAGAAAAGGGSSRGEAVTAEPEPEPEEKRLKCPSCEHIFHATIRPGEDIVCPECGYRASTTG